MGNRVKWKKSELDKAASLLRELETIAEDFSWFDPEHPNLTTETNRLKKAIRQASDSVSVIRISGNEVE